ncbi:alpha-amylase [Adhaeribacter aerolatus]|uniref:Alpha-amylase n=1 Tax=Adhaeribacter aerolatus TaxID=670289 RepID=A0A512AYU8_9BACT|nr:alpha-amylase family glycosyl hydrolase [Adhaeribacter aerolatus]GEO04687.1 alpha-amylase [Adhaeribacter aerolatus]
MSHTLTTMPEDAEAVTLPLSPDNFSDEQIKDNKLVIYQIFTRLFGNKKTTNKTYGTLEENGCGKFNDIGEKALTEIQKLGATHVWYTGIIEHATLTDYTAYGIKTDAACLVKGRAGSPYAIKDYYDVNPDLAVDVKNRMTEFQALVDRTHRQGLKVIIDFVPNHVARSYHSDARPTGTEDFGTLDNTNVAFDPQNNFYYIPGRQLILPQECRTAADLEKEAFIENPAKVTGNDVFSATPSVNDWFETIKLNYGVDIQYNRTKHFDPIPDTWLKMHDILKFWTEKGVDGFRCDMAEMVPVEFWRWLIPQMKAVNPDLIFIAEIYNPHEYHHYTQQGQFDFLYDKVGLYDSLRRLMEGKGNTAEIIKSWKEETRGISSHMLRFLENHDEQRIASNHFAGTPWAAIPAMTVSATLASGPVMLYFGQEVGEPGKGNEGFQGEDGRTTIFDYWGVPEHQKWMNNGQFDGGALSPDQLRLREFYSRLLNLLREEEALRTGRFYQLYPHSVGDHGHGSHKLYAYLRYTSHKKLMIVVNFDRSHFLHTNIPIHEPELQLLAGNYKKLILLDLLNTSPDPEVHYVISEKSSHLVGQVILKLPPCSAYIFQVAGE